MTMMSDQRLPNITEKARLRVTLPGRDGQIVTWEELAKLEHEFGSDAVGQWLKGGKLVFPEPEAPKPKSKAFLEHMANLQRRQEQREYARMMDGAFPKGTSYLSQSMQSYSPEHTGVGASGFQMSVIALNMVIGIGCAYIGADYLGTQYGLTSIQRAGVSLTVMIFVMFLEMLLFIIRAGKFDELDNKRRKKQEDMFAPISGLGIQQVPDMVIDITSETPLIEKKLR